MRYRPLLTVISFALLVATPLSADERPNVLWITSEDNGPHLGAYGDEFADTPHLDALAARGLVYLNAWSNAPVCAPARTTIITGLYPSSLGAQHMRCTTRLPEGARPFPRLLRDAGYYCTNNSKEDYNLEGLGPLWDESSKQAHWRGRAPGQPFFAVFNITLTHESRIRKRPHTLVHDPAGVRVPAYHPDHPAVRRDWAQYHDKMTEMDARAGELLAELAVDGLDEDTVVFYLGDHGPGLPRCKRSPYDSGLHVPLIVSIPARFRNLAPEGYEAGAKSARLVSFVDLAPTMLGLAGIEPPGHLQGRAFCGAFPAPEPEVLFGFRDRMDERYDLVRSVRDRRFVYLRNYLPHLIPGQHIAYLFETPTTRVWRELHEAGELPALQRAFWEPKPPEELYDLAADPDEVRNLAESPEHRATLDRLRAAQHALALETRDLGFLPEAELRARAGDSAPYDLGHDDERYPLERILAAAERASSPAPATPALVDGLADPDAAVRYWSAVGLFARGEEAVHEACVTLRAMLGDASMSPRIAAAEALARYGDDDERRAALAVLVSAADLDEQPVEVTLAALNALDALDERAQAVLESIRALPRRNDAVPQRMSNYVPRLLDAILADLDG